MLRIDKKGVVVPAFEVGDVVYIKGQIDPPLTLAEVLGAEEVNAIYFANGEIRFTRIPQRCLTYDPPLY